MQFPIVNLNGTSAFELLEQHLVVKRHLTHAIAALQEACPHGRDYQTLGDYKALQALHIALDEHSNRLLRLRQVLVEIETIAEHVI
jgi:hypothetical protein